MSNPENGNDGRRPAAFNIDEKPATLSAETQAENRRPRRFDDGVVVTPDELDPFIGGTDPSEGAEIPAAPAARKRFSFINLALGAFTTFLSLAFGLWADQVIRDLFTRSDWLGYAATIALVIAILALLVVVGREIAGMMRLSAVQLIRSEAAEARQSARPAAARKLVSRLVNLLGHRAETAKGRAVLGETQDQIIDGPQLVDLAERELLAPLDRKARALIMASSKRVSVVTAVSPRAIVDLAYVLFEVTRLIRSMADLYGGRPGTIGLIRLMRDVVAHLAVTGSIAVGDSLAQQLLGHGLASRLSSRLGEGVINGLLTARIGIAAMDLCRPLPFTALKRPGIGDFLADITSTGSIKD